MAGTHGRPHLLWVTASLGLTGEDQPRHTRTRSSLSFLGNKCRKFFGCFLPRSSLLSDHAAGSSSSPAPPPALCPLVKSQETPEEHMRGRGGPYSAVRHRPCPPLASSHHLQRLGGNRGRLGLSLTTRPVYPPPSHEGKKKVKQKQTKKIFCTEIYFYYTKFVQYQKRKKKRCKFFFHYCR